MKNVLLLVHDDPGQEARLQAALDVVRAVHGQLICFDVATPVNLAGENRAALERRLGAEGLPWNWVNATGDITTCLKNEAELADLIVLNRQPDSFQIPDMRALASELVVTTGKPLLAAPEASRGIRLNGHAVIAWDGSDEAEAAMRAAVPLLKLAQRVTIVEIVDGSVTTPAEDAAAWLLQQGIWAGVHPKHPNGTNAGREILTLLKIMTADYVVMGGFGHSQLREAVFGGVSRHMLTHSPVPLLIAH